MTRKSAQSPKRVKLTLRQLEVFLATAGAGSTRGAAERVYRSQSAASGSLRELEAALGTQVFDRIGKRLLLNEQGRILLPQAASLLDQVADLQQQFNDALALPLRVAASLTAGEYVLPSLLARWKVDHPASRLQLRIMNSSGVMEAVSALAADVGFIEGPQTHADLQVFPWIADDLIIVASPQHPLARTAPTNRQLQRAVWALREPGSGTREAADRWLFESLGPLLIEFEVDSTEALKRIAAQGIALTCLPRRAVEEQLLSGVLAEVRTRLPRATRRLAMVLHRGRRPSRSTREFIALCRGLA
ncbi:MAG: LysR family transcriptional regulator [Burkholderiaceae bacterium]|nr:LysR family transcriptional regulator [Burkholderiaceae bacterium]